MINENWSSIAPNTLLSDSDTVNDGPSNGKHMTTLLLFNLTFVDKTDDETSTAGECLHGYRHNAGRKILFPIIEVHYKLLKGTTALNSHHSKRVYADMMPSKDGAVT